MTAEQFAYWMQGFAELNEQPPSAEQWQAIRDHLALVLSKAAPPLSGIGSPSRWAFPTGAPNAGGTILLSGDGDTRFVC